MQVATRAVVPLILLAQIGLSLTLALVAWGWSGRTAAASIAMGGLVAVIPNAFLAARVLKPRADTSAAAMLRAAWLGEIGKLFLTALLFWAIFALVRPISALAVFGGFIAAQLVILGALLLDGRAGNKT